MPVPSQGYVKMGLELCQLALAGDKQRLGWYARMGAGSAAGLRITVCQFSALSHA